MRHLRKDYEGIQPPAEMGWPEDEPVLVIRGQDLAAPDTARAWADIAEGLGTDPAVCDAVRDWAVEMEAWQERTGRAKVPDVPADALPSKEV